MYLAIVRDVGWVAGAIALIGVLYALLAAVLASRFMRAGRGSPLAHAVPVTILKPLRGDEPGLSENLETFFVQDYRGPVQIVFGASDKADPALDIVRALQAKYPGRDTSVVADPARHGSNGKVSNLVNMLPAARYRTLVLSDSDIAVGPDWLAQVVAALSRPGVGVVTCFYTGAPARPAGRLWPSLAAMGTSYDFLPNALVGTSLGLAAPCFGSTIALERDTLDKVGGFASFANLLADDYEIGRAVRKLGYGLAIPALGVSHATRQASLGAILRQELRWTRTIRMINPGGHLGSIVTHAFAFALISAILLDFAPLSLGLVGLTLAARLFLKYRIDAIFGVRSGSPWLLPVRDLLSFAVFMMSLFGETVHWQGSRFQMGPAGAMTQS
jgi:ceramide glucosyltransferase